ncbi:MAG: hypothetical protein JNL08_12995 [Planctomycetes bacterium]|nr:hypothetical protein [Planctomycetota bacterium]
MNASLLSSGIAVGARLPVLLAATLLAVAPASAQSNVRECSITLRSRPAGSAPTTAYSTIYSVGTSGLGWQNFPPANVPIAPFAASGSWQLAPGVEYQVEFQADLMSTAFQVANASLGQRADFQLIADFSAAAAVSWTSISHSHSTRAGYLPSWVPAPTTGYWSVANVLPWSDSSFRSAFGQNAEGTTSIAFVPTSAAGAALTYLASAEVNSVQVLYPPIAIGTMPFGYYRFRSTLEFQVAQPMAVDLDVAASGDIRGESQHFPLLPIALPGEFAGHSGWWYDPPLALGFDFQQSGGSLFTDILELPVGIDGDGLFEVEVGGQSLGQFAAGARVDFVQLLGHGVAAFRIAGIDPAVDATDAAVFPVRLAFDTPTARFTMTPVTWRKVGGNCTDPTVCPQCPALELAPTGSAVEGNLNFGLGIDHGPAGGLAAFFVGLGSASTTPVPLFCGSVVLPLQNAFFDVGAVALVGTSSCDGAGSVPLPLVPVPSLLGQFLTVQALTICPAGGLGLTHGIEFAIGS